jgi:hypothetical protein
MVAVIAEESGELPQPFGPVAEGPEPSASSGQGAEGAEPAASS